VDVKQRLKARPSRFAVLGETGCIVACSLSNISLQRAGLLREKAVHLAHFVHSFSIAGSEREVSDVAEYLGHALSHSYRRVHQGFDFVGCVNVLAE
jgi:hypothetical protein